jgi:hypothetical protein
MLYVREKCLLAAILMFSKRVRFFWPPPSYSRFVSTQKRNFDRKSQIFIVCEIFAARLYLIYDLNNSYIKANR